MIDVGEMERKLLEAAAKVMDNAHVLFGFKVGAAVLAEDGQIYGGCNVESWVSGLGICAERCAVNHAVLHGNKKIEEVAVVADAKKRNAPLPCGSCLQYISDFAANQIKIVMGKAENGRILSETIDVKSLHDLLPHPYKK